MNKQRTLHSLPRNAYICSACGNIGKSKKTIVGSWVLYFLRLSIGLPFVVVLFSLSMLEGLFRFLTPFCQTDSIIWSLHFSHFLPHAPASLKGCTKCGEKNSMHSIRSQEGKFLLGKFKHKIILQHGNVL